MTAFILRFRFIAGFLIASLLFTAGAVAVNVNNTPQGGYLLCANTKTKAVIFPGTLKCPNGTKEIFVPGSNMVTSDNSENTSNNSSSNQSNGKGNLNCNLTYLQNNPNQIETIVPQCSNIELSKLQNDLSKYDQDFQLRIQTEQNKLKDLQRDADAKKGGAGAQAAADAVEKQALLVADLISKIKNNTSILTAIVLAIQKKVKG